MGKYLLGIDIGTSSCKIAIFNTSGGVQAEMNKSHRTYRTASGWIEQNPDEWWENICDGIRECLQKSGISSKSIEGIGIAGQGWSMIPIDEDGNCLTNTPIWMDTRAKDIANEVEQEIGTRRIFDLAGNLFFPTYTTPKMIWLKKEHIDLYAKTECFLQSNSYIGYKLTGALSSDKSQNYGLHFYNTKTCTYDTEMAEAFGLDINKVAPIYDCHEVIGKVTNEAAEQTGLMPGTPVVAGGLDAACGTLGAGVHLPNQAQIQGGQAGGMSICLDQPVVHEKLIFSPHVVPNLWLLQGGTVGGGGVLRWFREKLSPEQSFDELTQLASKINPGSDGVLFLPYMAGERSPIWNPDAKAVFYGLGFDKTKAHMLRSVLEGVVLSVYHNVKVAENAGVDIKALEYYAMGGVANSEMWIQIYADVFGKKMNIPSSNTATTLGAAMLAGVGIGLYDSFSQAVEKTITVSREQKPTQEHYNLYQEVFKKYLALSKKFV